MIVMVALVGMAVLPLAIVETVVLVDSVAMLVVGVDVVLVATTVMVVD